MLKEQIKNYKPSEDGNVNSSIDPFLGVMSKEYDGHRRLFGRVVTNKLIKKMNGGETSCMVPKEFVESLKESFFEAEKSELVDKRKDLAEDYERKKAELEEVHERKKAELEAMRDKIVEDVVKKLVGILQQ